MQPLGRLAHVVGAADRLVDDPGVLQGADELLCEEGVPLGSIVDECDDALRNHGYAELLRDPDVLNGDYTIKWLEEWLARDDERAG